MERLSEAQARSWFEAAEDTAELVYTRRISKRLDYVLLASAAIMSFISSAMDSLEGMWDHCASENGTAVHEPHAVFDSVSRPWS